MSDNSYPADHKYRMVRLVPVPIQQGYAHPRTNARVERDRVNSLIKRSFLQRYFPTCHAIGHAGTTLPVRWDLETVYASGKDPCVLTDDIESDVILGAAVYNKISKAEEKYLIAATCPTSTAKPKEDTPEMKKKRDKENKEVKENALENATKEHHMPSPLPSGPSQR